MRKFKHIKTGEEAKPIEGHLDFYSVGGGEIVPKRFIEDNCDWEEVVEKEYEILSLITNRFFGITTSKIDIEVFEDSSPLTVNYKIYSVKRLSDGEIFTIGDKIRFIDESLEETYPCRVIKNFKIENNTIIAICDDNGVEILLKNLKQVKQPLFTTEDGVDIFEGDAIFGINAYGEVFSHCSGLPNKIMNWGKNPIFSTQVLAERYIELNSPKYTALDMLKVANHYAYIKNVTEDRILKYLAKNGI